jgi:hypothetical protein
MFRIMRSKAKILKLGVNLLVIKREDFFRSIMNNFTFNTEYAGEE